MWAFLGFGFTDSVMDKIAFNNPYRFVAAIFRGAETLLKKRGLSDGPPWGLVTQKNDASPERRREADCSSSLAN
jgi:hypothetical protein